MLEVVILSWQRTRPACLEMISAWHGDWQRCGAYRRGRRGHLRLDLALLLVYQVAAIGCELTLLCQALLMYFATL